MKQSLTHSRMQSFKACRKRHWWEYEIGMRRVTDAKALRMGTAGHAGLEQLKISGDVRQAVNDVRALYSQCPDEVDSVDWQIEAVTVECLVAGYAWRWKNQPLETLEVEQTFDLPVINPETQAQSTCWTMRGKIDGVVRLEDGREAIIEHKIISQDIAPESDFWRRLQLDSQISLYVWAARHRFPEISTVLYDVVRKPTIRPATVPLMDNDGLKVVLDSSGERVYGKTGKPRQTGSTADGYVLQSRQQTPDEWAEKLMDDIARRPEFYFQRHEIARLDSDLQEMQEEVWDIQKTMRDAQNRDRWYKTVAMDSCTWCAFFGLCSSRYEPVEGEAPDGFQFVTTLHPELEEIARE